VNKKLQTFNLVMFLGGALLLGACNKKVAKVVPPAPPLPAPTATVAANPSDIQLGQSTELTWKTTNASSISIEELGTLPSLGSRSVTPSSSTTYTLVAKGPGGVREVTTRVTVNSDTAKLTSPSSASDEELFGKTVTDIFFDFDKSTVRSDQKTTADKDANFLAQHPNLKILIEGHCDDRGSEEYNLALGDSRASSLKDILLAQGVSGDQIKTITYGKERPFCSQDNEQCRQQNRRDHLSLQR
jgi:peptidoglycan-associated lipoprotein